ncbi:MAG TPA: hypothetical protein VN962_20445 [Polyangia bacterium]|nr:hypothetical protein [Polyangia bacterium]
MTERARSTHRTGAFLLGALAALAAGAAACSLSQEGVMPPADTLFFPAAAVMPPDGQWLYVANSNADLRYNDGTLAMLNVGEDVVTATADGTLTLRGAASDRARPGQWAVCPQQDYVHPLSRGTAPTCCWDVLDSNILNCDERLYVQSDATVRIGSFTAGMVWQNYCDGKCAKQEGCPFGDGARIILGVRGDTSLTWVDVVPDAYAPHPSLHCRQDGTVGSLAECTQKVTSMRSNLLTEAGDTNAPDVQLPDEPYALTLDIDRDLLYVGHLVGNTSTPDSGGISVFNVSPNSSAPSAAGFPPEPAFITPTSSPFPANGGGNFGITNLTLHAPLGADPRSAPEIFASSRYLPLVTSLTPFLSGSQSAMEFNCGDNSDVVLLNGPDSLSSGLVGSEIRGVSFFDPPPSALDEGQRVFALQRVPPALIGFEVNRTVSGGLTSTPTSVIETCSGPTFLYEHDAGNGMRFYVNCFDTGEIYVFDPTLPALITSFQVGRGPAGMVFDTKLPVAYVLDFSQNDIVVVDLKPGSPTEDHVIQRIGFPSTTPR